MKFYDDTKLRVPTIWKYQGKPGKLQNIFPVREKSGKIAFFGHFWKNQGKLKNVREKNCFLMRISGNLRLWQLDKTGHFCSQFVCS